MTTQTVPFREEPRGVRRGLCPRCGGVIVGTAAEKSCLLCGYEPGYLAYQRAWNQKHREERLAYYRAWNQKHREERLAYQRAWNQKHREERRR